MLSVFLENGLLGKRVCMGLRHAVQRGILYTDEVIDRHHAVDTDLRLLNCRRKPDDGAWIVEWHGWTRDHRPGGREHIVATVGGQRRPATKGNAG